MTLPNICAAPREIVPRELLLLADPSIAHIEDYLDRGCCYLAYEASLIVGAIVLLPTRPQTMEIINLAVRESHQGRGIGRALLMHACEEARRMHCRTIEIGTGNSSIHQLKLYQRLGFRIVGVDIDYFVRNYTEEIVEDGIPCTDMIRLRKELYAEEEIST